MKLINIRSWLGELGFIANVDQDEGFLDATEDYLDINHPEIRYKSLLGKFDEIITTNSSSHRSHGNLKDAELPSNDEENQSPIWSYELVHLDYRESLVPAGGSNWAAISRMRNKALRDLLSTSRVDARRPWLLIFSFSTTLSLRRRRALRNGIRSGLQEFAKAPKEDAESLLSNDGSSVERNARLIHAWLSVTLGIAIASAGLKMIPRGSVLFDSDGHAIIRTAFELHPRDENIAKPKTRVTAALRAPIFRVDKSESGHKFSTVIGSLHNFNTATTKKTMEFMDPTLVPQD